ncbi:(2Fe-2S)-binding protein [Paenibacillus solisilvae]|uniref:(2Fe-2S)-binding protein n=1 Tax=Paenibacillus solisilvae TaxID=2486751 RepID=A0ABW0VUV5_9BACL
MSQTTAARTERLERDCGIVFNDPGEVIQAYTFDELLDLEQVRSFLTLYAGLIKATELSPAATYFVSYLRGLTTAVQSLMSLENAAMDWSLSNWSLLLVAKDGYTNLKFRPVNSEITDAAPNNRDEWRNRILADFYGKTIQPLIRTLAQEANLSQNQLWATMPTSLYYYKESVITRAEVDSPVYKQIISDYEYLVNEMDGNVFGLTRNPLKVKIKMVDNPYNPGEQMPLKSSCCLAYLTEGRNYCYTCPKMTKTERAEKYEAIRAISTANT